jgi:hypothetical protein
MPTRFTMPSTMYLSNHALKRDSAITTPTKIAKYNSSKYMRR